MYTEDKCDSDMIYDITHHYDKGGDSGSVASNAQQEPTELPTAVPRSTAAPSIQASPVGTPKDSLTISEDDVGSLKRNGFTAFSFIVILALAVIYFMRRRRMNMRQRKFQDIVRAAEHSELVIEDLPDDENPFVVNVETLHRMN